MDDHSLGRVWLGGVVLRDEPTVIVDGRVIEPVRGLQVSRAGSAKVLIE